MGKTSVLYNINEECGKMMEARARITHAVPLAWVSLRVLHFV